MGLLEKGKVYVCNYLTGTSAGAQDLSGKTLGTDYIEIDVTEDVIMRLNHDGERTIFYGGKTWIWKEESTEDQFRFVGWTTTFSDFMGVKSFSYKGRKNSISHYLFYKIDDTNWWKFYDEDEAEKNYCKGWLKESTLVYHPQDDSLKYMTQNTFLPGWD